MFKVCRNESPPIFEETFLRSVINYNLRSNSEFAVPNVRSVFLGSESNSYLYPKIWVGCCTFKVGRIKIFLMSPTKVLKCGSRKTVQIIETINIKFMVHCSYFMSFLNIFFYIFFKIYCIESFSLFICKNIFLCCIIK